jgi:hypothetical protein
MKQALGYMAVKKTPQTTQSYLYLNAADWILGRGVKNVALWNWAV